MGFKKSLKQIGGTALTGLPVSSSGSGLMGKNDLSSKSLSSIKNLTNWGKDYWLGEEGTPSTSESSAKNIDYLISNPLQTPDYSNLIGLSKTGSSTGTNATSVLNNNLTNNRSSYYDRLMSTVNAPSSVDSVRSDIYGQQYQNLLTAADKATNEAMGSGVGGYYRRGLINPNVGGVSSDIASVGLGNIAAQGATAKTNAALALQQNLLDLQKQRETQAVEAAKLGYSTEAGADQSTNQLYANLLNSQEERAATAANLYANLLNQGMSAQNARDIAYATANSSSSTGATDATQGALSALGMNFNSSFGSTSGSNLANLAFMCFDPKTPIEMADGSKKEIGKLELLDDTKGGKVYSIRRSITVDLYNYEGVKVTGSHCVLEDGEWKRVKDSEKAKKIFTPINGQEIVSISVYGHRIYSNGVVFDDEEETMSIGDEAAKNFTLNGDAHIRYLNSLGKEVVHA